MRKLVLIMGELIFDARKNFFSWLLGTAFNGKRVSQSLSQLCHAVSELCQHLTITLKIYLVWFLMFVLFFFTLKGHKEWLAEVQFLSVANHPNLVKLLGYCSIDSQRGIQRLLVYEFMSNRSLEDHLFSVALPPLPWPTRLQIMLGAAQGLYYLHNGLEIQVHCS